MTDAREGRRIRRHRRNPFLLLLRRLLYLVVRTQVTPEAAAELALDARPVCYVLEDRHLSSLLVLEEESERLGLPSPLAPIGTPFPERERAVFSVIINPNPLSPRTVDPSETLADLTGRVLADPSADVQLVPVSVLWGRAPGSQDSLLKALFADAWASVGPLRQLAIVLVHGRQTRVSFSAPVSLRRLVDNETDAATATRKANRFLRFHFRRVRESAIGPDLSHRRNLIETMIASNALRDAISAEAQRLGVSEAEAEGRARKFAWEIASDFSYPVIRAMEIALSRLWKMLYDDVDVRGLDALARSAPGKGIVYLPNHRSHIDYLLLSYFVHKGGLAPPHIAAGANLNFPIVGPLLRRGGAFFLRRKIKGEPLYAAVFREYLHEMLAKGFPIAYFIEGGRSRSGRTLAPKGGLLGMTIESYMREHPRSLQLVPLYIGYEKLLEGSSLLAELEGRPKQRESVWALLGTLRSLKRDYGSVHMRFGTPVAMEQFLEENAPGWQALEDSARTDAARRLTAPLGRLMTERINDGVDVNPINLFAMAIASSPRHALDERALGQQIEWLRTIAERLPYSPESTLTADSPESVIAAALKLGFAVRVANPLGEIIQVAERQIATVSYFRNNVLHAFALPALVANLLSSTRESTFDGIADFCEGALPFLRAELMLHDTPETARAKSRRIAELFLEMGLARATAEGALLTAERYSAEHAALELLGRSLRNLIRRNYLTIAILTRVGSGQLNRPQLEDLMQMLTQRLSLLFEFAPPDFYERTAFATYFDTLLETGIVHEDGEGWLHLDERIRDRQRGFERLLPADAVTAIRRLTAEHAAQMRPAEPGPRRRWRSGRAATPPRR
jgi:glycerol-3-phosphate O-acyltransferase